jgi:hypothetical protein
VLCFPQSGKAMTETRKLAAILVSDVVGHSRLAAADEEGVLAKLKAFWNWALLRAIANSFENSMFVVCSIHNP